MPPLKHTPADFRFCLSGLSFALKWLNLAVEMDCLLIQTFRIQVFHDIFCCTKQCCMNNELNFLFCLVCFSSAPSFCLQPVHSYVVPTNCSVLQRDTGCYCGNHKHLMADLYYFSDVSDGGWKTVMQMDQLVHWTF